MMNLKCLSLLAALLLPLSGAVAQSQTLPAGLDVNDVSVLFPLDAQQRPVPFVDLQGSKAKRILNAEHFQAIISHAEGLGIAAPALTSIKEMKDWAVVGFRYDPCAPRDHGPDVKECMQELRLVAQPLTAAGPADSALHLIYGIAEGDALIDDPAISDLLSTKNFAEGLAGKSTSGTPLGVHPLLSLAKDGSLPDLPALYASLMLRYAQGKNLKKLTMMGLKAGSQTHWMFFGGNIVKGKWIASDIPNLPEGDKTLVELNLQSFDKVFIPTPEKIEQSTFGFFHREVLQSDDEFQELKNAIHRFENPAVNNRNTTDCLSCHSATTLRMASTNRVPMYVEGLTMKAPVGITAYPEPKSLQRHRLHWNLRAFGYFGNQATLSMRTVFEAGRVADAVNKIAERSNPGFDCSAVEAQVQSCFVNTSALFQGNGAATSADCLKSCQKRAEDPGVKPGLDLGKVYSLVSRSSAKCLDLDSGSQADGGRIQQWACDGGLNQKFRFKKIADDSYQLVSERSGKCIDVSEVSQNDGAVIHQWTCGQGLNQVFSVLPSESGASILKFKHSGKCLDLAGPSSDNGATIHQWTCHGQANQDWILKAD